MLIKYKIHEVSKDFGVSSKELIGLLHDKLGVDKKSQTSLEDNELNLIFDYLTKKNEVESFDDYFAAGERAREERAAARKAEKDRKLAEQMAVLEQLKAAKAAQAAESAPKAETVEAQAAENAGKQVVKLQDEPKTETKAEPKTEAAPKRRLPQSRMKGWLQTKSRKRLLPTKRLRLKLRLRSKESRSIFLPSLKRRKKERPPTADRSRYARLTQGRQTSTSINTTRDMRISLLPMLCAAIISSASRR